MPQIKDDIFLGEKYAGIIGQSQVRDEAGIGTIVPGNPFNTKINLGYEDEESQNDAWFDNFEEWENTLSELFPSARIEWERDLCRATVNGVKIGFYDQQNKSGYLIMN